MVQDFTIAKRGQYVADVLFSGIETEGVNTSRDREDGI